MAGGESMEMEEVLAAEMSARTLLNDLQKERSRIHDDCCEALQELNRLKRLAYRMGFAGNIMRDAAGNRVNSIT